MTATVTRPALLSAVAYILQGAGITPAELAQHMGQQPMPALPAAPTPANPRKKRQVSVISPTVEKIVQLVNRPEGALVTDVQEHASVNQQSANQHLLRLIQAGQAVRIRAPGEQALRYFGSREAADAYEAQRKAAQPRRQPKRAALSQLEVKALATAEKKRAAAKKSAPPLGARNLVPNAKGNLTFSPPIIDDTKLRPQGRAVETEATKRTIDRTPRPGSRVEAMPALPPDPRWPRFSSTPLGVNPDTGMAWA